MKKLILLFFTLLFTATTAWAQMFGPFADPVTVSGTLEVGETLSGSYEYFDMNGTPEDGTTFQWYRIVSEFDPPVPIVGATGETYTLAAEDDGNIIVFEVTPSNGSEIGEPTPSDPVGPIGGDGGGPGGGNTAPVASNISFTGTLEVGATLTGSYDYSDGESDAESGSLYTWYRSNDGAGTGKTPIGGADSNTYTLVEADEGKHISFSVIPSDGTDPGTQVESSLQGPVLAESPSITFAGGSGIEADPYQIATLEQFQAMKDSPSSYYILNNDIDASATSTWNSGAGFVPIGGGSPFTGNFDGQGFVITGLTIDRPTEDYVGLFAVIGNGGSVSNIGLAQLSVTGGANTGGLAGESNGSISGSHVSGSVEGSTPVGGLVALNNANITSSYSAGTVAGTQDVGGLVGLHSLGTISKSYSTSDVTGSANNVGGLIGFAYDNVENSFATGSASGDTNVGGFAGNYNSGTVTNSYSTGTASGSSSVGGFIGLKNGFAAATNSFWDTEASGTGAGVGAGNSTGITGKTTTEMQTQSTFTGVSWDFTDVWTIDAGKNGGYPIQQDNLEEVVNSNPTGAVSITGTAQEGETLTASNTLSDEDGLGAITYQWQRDGVNIVGATNSTYTLVQNDVGAVITVVASYTDGIGTAESETSAGTAAVANVNDTPTGSVTISGTAQEDETLTASNTLSDEDGLGAITYQWQRGGINIVGATNSTYTLVQDDVGEVMTVVASYTDGEGTAESETSVGTDVVISNNTAPVASNINIGEESVKIGTQITAIYDFTDADGDTESGSTYQWYRADDASGTGAVAVTDSTAKTYTPTSADNFKYLRLDVTPNDGIEAGTTVSSGYVLVSPFEGGSGTVADPYLITTAAQLDAIRTLINEENGNDISQHFKLMNDINLDVAPYNDGKGWVPFAKSEIGESFRGQFDGDGHTISGLYINSGDYNYMGMFGYVVGGSISNVTFSDVDITSSGEIYTSPLGYIFAAAVSNVHVTGKVSGTTVGGIAGALWSNGTITESSFNGTVTGTNVGGIAGDIESDGDNTTISKSYSAGSISGSNAGGIVGGVTSGGTISDSYSLASVSGSTFEGGIIGGIGATQANTYFAGSLSDAATNSYWNTSGEQTSDVSTSAMKDSLTFVNAGFDFTNTWAIVTGDSISYPYLQANPQSPIPGKELTNTAPVASNAEITGTPKVGEVLAATYDYSDEDGDTNAGASFQWYRAADTTATVTSITGATDSLYTVSSEDVGLYVKVEITPNDGLESGVAVSSGWVNVPPIFLLAENGVTITCSDAAVGDTGIVNGIEYTKRSRDQITTENAATTCTSGITDMSSLFLDKSAFNQDIGSWDVSSVTDMGLMFYNAPAFNKDIGSWDVSKVTNMRAIFYNVSAFNKDIGRWDVSSVTDIGLMFRGASAFNQDISRWDMSSVANMFGMFEKASSFNQYIGGWDVSSVTEMSYMFVDASSFNQNIGSWIVSSVTKMAGMFLRASSFNQDIGAWEVSSVWHMANMFQEATSFNQNLSQWDVSNVIRMNGMFNGAASFDQDLGDWDISKVQSFEYNDAAYSFLVNSGLTTPNYDSLLIGWAALPIVQPNQTLNVGAVQYTPAAAAARAVLTGAPNNWIINDGGATNNVPVASNAAIAGIPKVGETLAATYDYSDADGDANVGASFQWYRAADSLGTDSIAIEGATDSTYTSVSADGNKFLKVEITPNDGNKGSTVSSDWLEVARVFLLAENGVTVTCSEAEVGETGIVNEIEYTKRSKDQITTENAATTCTSGITDMSAMFFTASSFNQDIGAWDVSSVTDMEFMFSDASSFNQDIGSWDVSSVTVMSGMFEAASSFNQDISRWDVSSVIDIQSMFFDASAFDQNLGDWDISSVDGSFLKFLENTALSTSNYDSLLIGWAALPSVQPNQTLSVGTVAYTPAATAAREVLTGEPNNWTIIDGGITNNPPIATNAAIAGTPKVGDTLRVQYTYSDPDGDAEFGSTFQWYRAADSLGTDSVAIEGATDSTYIPVSADADKFLSVSVTPNDGSDAGQSVSSPWVGSVPPVFLLADNGVTITCSEAAVGDTGTINDIEYTKRSKDQITPENAAITCTSGITDMSSLFSLESSFNGNISSWDVSSVIDMNNMFELAIQFNQDIGDWDVSSVTNMSDMFSNATSFSTANYDALLIGWSGLSSLQADVPFGANSTKYSTVASSARNILTSEPNNWIITDGGRANTAPVASNAAIVGTPKVGETLAATYDYSDADGNANVGASFQWYRAADSLGTDSLAIEGATDSTYTPVSADINKFLKVEITPNDGFDEGQPVRSPWVGSVPPVFLLVENGITITCSEAEVGDVGTVNGTEYTKRSKDQITRENAATTCTSGITDMSSLFSLESRFNGNISSWDVSSVTDMAYMFNSAEAFNQDIGSWDVSLVTDMAYMFNSAEAFNQDIGNWDVSSVTDMWGMFSLTAAFNQDIGSWDVSSVTGMAYMFHSAAAFNQNIGSWDVSSVTDMAYMFHSTAAFNQDIGSWDVSSVSYMLDMFHSTEAFNQDIGDWDVSSVTDMSYMFAFSFNFNQNLNDWDVRHGPEMGGMFWGSDSWNNGNAPRQKTKMVNGVEVTTSLDWDVSNVTNMASMFQGARAFNQDISSWDVSNVQYFDIAPSESTDTAAKEVTVVAEQNSSDQELNHLEDINELKEVNDRKFIGLIDEDIATENGSRGKQKNGMVATEPDSIAGFLVGSGMTSATASKMFVEWSKRDLQDGVSINIGAIELNNEGATAMKTLRQANNMEVAWGGEEGVIDEPVFTGLPNPYEIQTEDTRIIKLWDYVSDNATPDNELAFKFSIDSDSTQTIGFDTTSGELAITAPAYADTFFVAIQVANNENIVSLDTLEVRTGVLFTSSEEMTTELPASADLKQNYPNPFNPSTIIRYGVPQTSKVHLEVFDLLGRKVATLVNDEQKNAGWHQVNFDASNLASGIYIYRIVAGNYVKSHRMTLIK